MKKEIRAQLFSSEFCEISKNTFSYRRPPIAPSDSADFNFLFFQPLASSG